jgi:hypothetical protein
MAADRFASIHAAFQAKAKHKLLDEKPRRESE